MKALFSQIAIKLVESKFSDECIMACGSILKEAFYNEGFNMALSNEYAIDSLKIIMTTLSKIK